MKASDSIMLQPTESLTTAFCYVGAIVTCYWTVLLARHLYCYVRPSSLPRYIPPGRDSWAFVTGAADGIGFGFAQELCKRGFNVFLHSRNREKLLQKQKQLQNEYPRVKTKIIVFDSTDMNENTASIDRIAPEIGDAHLTVLINNVGGETKPFQSLTDMDYRDVQDRINLNSGFMVQITRVLLPILEKNSPSLIINMSSVTSYGLPWLTVYSGSKGFVDSFSHALNAEMKAEGKRIEVTGIRVANVQSKSNSSGVSLFTPTSRGMANAALNRVGCGRSLVIGYWWHCVQELGFVCLPRAVMLPLVTMRLRDLKREAEKTKKTV